MITGKWSISYAFNNSVLLVKDKAVVAKFFGPDAKTNAQKILELLQEASRSQGKHT